MHDIAAIKARNKAAADARPNVAERWRDQALELRILARGVIKAYGDNADRARPTIEAMARYLNATSEV